MNWFTCGVAVVFAVIELCQAETQCQKKCTQAINKYIGKEARVNKDSFETFKVGMSQSCPLLQEYKTCAATCDAVTMKTLEGTSSLCEVDLFLKTNEKHTECLSGKEDELYKCLYKYTEKDAKDEGDYGNEDNYDAEEEEEHAAEDAMQADRKLCCYRMARLQCYYDHLPKKCNNGMMHLNFDEPLFSWSKCPGMTCDGIKDPEGKVMAISGSLPNLDNFTVPSGKMPHDPESSSSISPSGDNTLDAKGGASSVVTITPVVIATLISTILRLN